MCDFFHGWRRKFGVVILLMACTLMGLWIRSLLICTSIYFPSGDRDQVIASLKGGIVWHATGSPKRGWGLGVVKLEELGEIGAATTRLTEIARIQAEEYEGTGLDYRAWTLQYNIVAIPLTLLSAYLILWKPRKGVKADA